MTRCDAILCVVTAAAPAPPVGVTTAGHRRADIQGLRAVAVVGVVAAHVAGWPGSGYLGVDVFFVISGFVITGVLLRDRQRRGRISLRAFYARRARRILPLALVVLALTVAVSAWALTARGPPRCGPTPSGRHSSCPTGTPPRSGATTSRWAAPPRPSCTSGRSGWRSSSTSCGPGWSPPHSLSPRVAGRGGWSSGCSALRWSSRRSGGRRCRAVPTRPPRSTRR